MTKKAAKNAAVQVAKRVSAEDGEIKIQYLGPSVAVRIIPVSTSLIDEVQSKIKDPSVPIWHNEEKGRDEENPSDPVYLQELQEAVEARGRAATDAIILFGVELVDPVPEDDLWVKKLNFVGIEFDSEDPFIREFSYKKFIVVGGLSGLKKVGEATGLSAGMIAEMEATF